MDKYLSVCMALFWLGFEKKYLQNVTASGTGSKFKQKPSEKNKLDSHQSVTFLLFYNKYTWKSDRFIKQR